MAQRLAHEWPALVFADWLPRRRHSRSLLGIDMTSQRCEPGAVVVARPTKWGNPFQGDGSGADHHMLVDLFARHMMRNGTDLTAALVRHELRGKDLACWCALDQPCHADVLLELANATHPNLWHFTRAYKRPWRA